jgi:hypothetical protein
MSPLDPLNQIAHWISQHPGVFQCQFEGGNLQLREISSGKTRSLGPREIHHLEEKQNSLKPQENYLIVLLENGVQLVLAPQGFVFGPDFGNTGPLSLPSQVYCLQDYHQLFSQLSHVAAEPDRRREALDLILVLIAILDGARTIGLDVDVETRNVEKILKALEQGEALPPPHGAPGKNYPIS